MQTMEFLEISQKIKENIRKKVADSGLSMRQISLRAGKNAGLISEILRGKTEDVQSITILKIAEALHCSSQELTGNSGGIVKVVALITGNNEIIHLTETDKISVELLAMVDPDNFEARIVKGDWNSRIEDGWAVIYRNLHRPMREGLLNILCVGKTSQGKEFFGKVRHGSQLGKYHITLNNGDPIIDAEIEWCESIEFIIPKKN